MGNEKNKWVVMSITIAFIELAYILSFLLQHLMRVQFGLPDSKILMSLFSLIIAAYALGNFPMAFIKAGYARKREWLKNKRNQRILLASAFLLNIPILFLFIYKARTQLNLPYSLTLFADGLFILLAYALGIACMLFIDYVCRKVNQKAAQLEERSKGEEKFRQKVNAVSVLGPVGVFILIKWIINAVYMYVGKVF